MTGASLAIRDVAFRYGGGRPVLDGLDLDVAAGERIAVLGPNGCGKTTLALHLNGLLPLQEGSISVDDLAVAEPNLTTIRRRVGLVFQNPDDQLFMSTVHEDVAFGPANCGVTRDERDRLVERSLASVDATHLADRHPHHLSGGEKRRAAIATILAMEPAVIVFDEPTSGLDPLGRRELAELLVGIDATQLVITHDLPFALASCPRSVILSDGRVVADAARTRAARRRRAARPSPSGAPVRIRAQVIAALTGTAPRSGRSQPPLRAARSSS